MSGLFALMLAACQPAEVAEPVDSQEAYRYPGCADDPYTCPQGRTLFCAIETIQHKYSQCELDSDCVFAGLAPNCMSVGLCPPLAVRKGEAFAFSSEANAELEKYCGEAPSCRMAIECAFDPSTFRAACEEGRCVSKDP